MAQGEVFIVSAPSGTGKNTLIERVIASLEGVEHSISHTTRQPRPGETEGDPYYFIERADFEEMVGEGAFLEWAEYNGNLYGTSAREVDRRTARGADVILDIEVVGAEQLLSRRPDAHAIFVLPPSFETLAERLRRRGQDDAASISRRLEQSVWEIERYRLYHYVIINDDLDRASQALAAVILEKRQRLPRQEEGVHRVLEDFRRR